MTGGGDFKKQSGAARGKYRNNLAGRERVRARARERVEALKEMASPSSPLLVT